MSCSAYHQTWKVVIEDPTIRSIQEPICEQFVDISDFNEAYQCFLVTLDGRDCTSYVDFFWQRSPTNTTCLEFIDCDARMDVYDFLRDEGLIPEMDQVLSGDWKFKKKKPEKKSKPEESKPEESKPEESKPEESKPEVEEVDCCCVEFC